MLPTVHAISVFVYFPPSFAFPICIALFLSALCLRSAIFLGRSPFSFSNLFSVFASLSALVSRERVSPGKPPTSRLLLQSIYDFGLFMGFLRVLFLLPLFSIAFSEDALHAHPLPRPLILEYTEMMDPKFEYEEARLRCTSWRFAAETNNLNLWKTIPSECVDYVKNYMMGWGYTLDLERVSNEAAVYARGAELMGDGKDAWVFDVDETLLSNLPYYTRHGYGLEIFDPVEFDKWVDGAMAPAIEPSLRLYEEVLDLGFKIFLLTGRSEKQRDITVQNLMNVGFRNWDKLMLRASDDHGKLATVYKSEKRGDMVEEGYRILGNSGDQWSDLLGSSMSARSFKLPNPMYYIP